MGTLDPLPSVVDLFDYRGAPGSDGGAPLWLPHHQGDVFEGVTIPGITSPTETKPLAMLFLHPCTMRRGAVLKGEVTMIEVQQMTSKVKDEPDRWSRNFVVMPLPDLRNAGQDTHAGQFLKIGTVQSSELPRDRRVAALSLAGRTIMQQRIINHFTRLVPTLDELQQATRAVEAEIQLQGDWVQFVCDKTGGITSERIEAAEAEFDAFMSEAADDSTATRRMSLQDLRQESHIVTQTYRELNRRYP